MRAGRIAAGVLVPAALVASGFYAVHGHDRLASEQQIADRRTSAARAASADVPALLTYRGDQAQVREQMDAARALVTSGFRAEFEELLTSLVEPTVAQKGFATTAEVSRIGVVSGDADAVTLLVMLSQRTKRPGGSLGEPVATRAEVRMVWSDGRWLVDDLKPV
ncbi:hypothetical protein GCM10022215_14650 [Nocardioides fonticola]|uniref:Mce-associated membrane protein n=1 Tax=Nocardioides fonticola TaxID=450363 RepID=A0ABP7XIQ6_9ACTN